MLLVASNDVKAQTLESITQQRKSLGERDTQFTVGVFPVDIKINQYTNKIYVANQESDSVTVIDSDSGNTKSIRVGAQPSSIAIDLKLHKIYVTNNGANTVSVIDGYNDSRIKDIPVGEVPTAIAGAKPSLNVTNKIYVANLMSHSVSVINDNTDSKMGYIDLGPNLQPEKIVEGFRCHANPLNRFADFGKPNDIFVGSHVLHPVGSTGGNGGNVSVISGNNDTKTGHDIRLGDDPTAIGVGSEKIYVANGLSVSVINPCNGKTQDVPVGNKLTATWR